MIFRYINVVAITTVLSVLTACSSSSSGSSSSGGISVSLGAAPSPANAAVMMPGQKVFMNDMGDTITLTKAYLVIASSTIETDCTGSSFSAAIENLFDLIVPVAHAHTTSTPTSTGVPYVIDLLAADNNLASIGKVSPPPGDYCGVTYDLIAADADTINLPSGTGEPDMIGKTLYVEGTYELSQSAGGATGNILLDTGATLIDRKMLLTAVMALSASNLNGTVNTGINYDTWFDAVDMATLETETASGTSPVDPNVGQVLQNITQSLHQL